MPALSVAVLSSVNWFLQFWYIAVCHQSAVCSQQSLTDDVIMAERQLSEQRPNVANRHELLQLMAVTRKVRSQWIVKEQPSITEILWRYPRLLDINETIPVFYSCIWWCLSLRVICRVAFHSGVVVRQLLGYRWKWYSYFWRFVYMK